MKKRNAVRSYLLKHGYRIADVTIDYEDWAWNDAYTRCATQHDQKSIAWLKGRVVEAAESRLRASKEVSELLFRRDIAQILLVHDGAFNTVMLDTILKDFRAKGVELIALDQALADPAYKISPNRAFNGGRTFLEEIAEARDVNIDRLEDVSFTVETLNAVCKPVGSK